MGTFYIRCEVYGGVTGHRIALLKGADGKVKEFRSAEEAQAECDRIYANLSPYRTASFSYTVTDESFA